MGILLKCSCHHERADKWWGKSKRLHNYALKGLPPNGNPGWRCVVCLNVKPVGAEYKEG